MPIEKEFNDAAWKIIPGWIIAGYLLSYGLSVGLVALVLAAYIPAFSAGFIWDDDRHVTITRPSDMDAGAMTRLLDRLEKKGFCKRVRSAEDRRVVNIELTHDGETAIAEVPAVLADVQNTHLTGFSRSEWQALHGYLQRMLANGEAIRNAAGPPPDPPGI